MQSLEVISINLWQILISLCNLLILFFLLKKFLYAPVKKIMKERQEVIDKKYDEAERAKADALQMKEVWTEKIESMQSEADAIIKEAVETADRHSQAILSETREKAGRLIHQAEIDAALERKKAEAGIKKEIVDVSTALSEKMLGREIKTADHRALIDSFISGIGEGELDDDGDN